MSLYEIVDFSGKTVLELGRFRSDREAIFASRNIRISPSRGELFVAKRNDSGSARIGPLEKMISPKKVLDELLDFCMSSQNQRISDLAKQYRRISA